MKFTIVTEGGSQIELDPAVMESVVVGIGDKKYQIDITEVEEIKE